jgi:plastocyanin
VAVRSSLRRLATTAVVLSAISNLGVPAPSPADVSILVGDFYFLPPDVTIAPGETITWVFKKGFHTTTNGTGESDPAAGTLWDAFIFSGQPTASFTFAAAGFYPYFCRFHESLSMAGTITVAAPTATSSTSWGAVKSLYR